MMAEAHVAERLTGGATEHRIINAFQRGKIFDSKMIHLAVLNI
jgi:methyl coenzyme M reductase beta subunit